MATDTRPGFRLPWPAHEPDEPRRRADARQRSVAEEAAGTRDDRAADTAEATAPLDDHAAGRARSPSPPVAPPSSWPS